MGPAWPGCAGTVPRARPKPGVSSGRGRFWFSSRRRAFHSASRGNTATLPSPLHTGMSFILSLPHPIPSSSCFSMEIYATAVCWIFLFSFHTVFFFFFSSLYFCVQNYVLSETVGFTLNVKVAVSLIAFVGWNRHCLQAVKLWRISQRLTSAHI